MNLNHWRELHQKYEGEDWTQKPSIFAEEVASHWPSTGMLLDLGAGQGQDSRYFAELGWRVTSTDIEPSALKLSRERAESTNLQLTCEQLDLRQPLPYRDAEFDAVYAHLSLHYFDHATTEQLFAEIYRVLAPGGWLAYLVNSTQDPEHGTGEALEQDFYAVDDTTKRYFTVESAKEFSVRFQEVLLDAEGETYKDRAKGVHHLIRFIGHKP